MIEGVGGAGGSGGSKKKNTLTFETLTSRFMFWLLFFLNRITPLTWVSVVYFHCFFMVFDGKIFFVRVAGNPEFLISASLFLQWLQDDNILKPMPFFFF